MISSVWVRLYSSLGLTRFTLWALFDGKFAIGGIVCLVVVVYELGDGVLSVCCCLLRSFEVSLVS